MFHDFIAKCLTKEPRLRPTASEMLKVCHDSLRCMPCMKKQFYIGLSSLFSFFFWVVGFRTHLKGCNNTEKIGFDQ